MVLGRGRCGIRNGSMASSMHLPAKGGARAGRDKGDKEEHRESGWRAPYAACAVLGSPSYSR